MSDRSKLGNFLKEVINWNWKEFCEAEKDPKYSGLEAVVLALVRTTSDAKLGAIRLAIDRVDGKLETPIEVVYPKVYYLFPHAEGVESVSQITEGRAKTGTDPHATNKLEVVDREEPVELATMSLRDTLNKMADAPRNVVPMLLERKKEVEKNPAVASDDDGKIPLVKSIIAANLLHLAFEKNNFDAITEVFDQIDGKLVETIRLLGDDIYLTQYAELAPAGATKNKDGVYQIEATEIANMWRQKLGGKDVGSNR